MAARLLTAEPPRLTQGLSDFTLPRAPSIALREYVPGNAIYANGFRFVPRHFQLTPDDTLRFRVDSENILGVDPEPQGVVGRELKVPRNEAEAIGIDGVAGHVLTERDGRRARKREVAESLSQAWRLGC